MKFKIGDLVTVKNFRGVIKGISLDTVFGNEIAIEFDNPDGFIEAFPEDDLYGSVDEEGNNLIDYGKGKWFDEKWVKEL